MAVEFTIFVDGLPHNMNSNWLRNLFPFFGKIVDVYISFKKRKFLDSVFGFVRFKLEEDALRAISSFDGKVFKSKTLKVCWAKHRRVANVTQPTRDPFTHFNEQFKALLNGCIAETIGSFKKDLLLHIQESIHSSLGSFMDKFSKEVVHSLHNASKDSDKALEFDIVESSFNGDGETINPSIIEELPQRCSDVSRNKDRVHLESDGESLGSESELDVVSNSNVEAILDKCTHSPIKEKKKKKKKKSKRKQMHREECLFLEEEWWSDQIFSFSEEEDFIQREVSNLLNSEGYFKDDKQMESTFESDEEDKNANEGTNIRTNLTDPPSKMMNKVFPSSKRLTRSLLIMRPRFLKFALGMNKASRKHFCRKKTVKYIIDNPPNRNTPLVLKPI